MLEWSDTYGPVIRIAPDELAYTHPDAWQNIYGHHTGATKGGHEEFPKSPHTYRTKGIQVSIAGDTKFRHRKLRKQLSPIFSERAIRDQEAIIGKYVSLLIKRLHEHCVQRETGRPKRLDMKAWYNWTTFDIIGDMSYGESFGCLERAAYDPWVADISETVRSGAEMQAFKLLGLENLLFWGYKWGLLFSARTDHEKRVHEKLGRRMKLGVQRNDFLAPLIENKNDWVCTGKNNNIYNGSFGGRADDKQYTGLRHCPIQRCGPHDSRLRDDCDYPLRRDVSSAPGSYMSKQVGARSPDKLRV